MLNTDFVLSMSKFRLALLVSIAQHFDVLTLQYSLMLRQEYFSIKVLIAQNGWAFLTLDFFVT